LACFWGRSSRHFENKSSSSPGHTITLLHLC
jgi:hypothetical protein